METKICTKCGVEYPATKEWFQVRKDSKDGLRGVCKNCMNKESKIRYKKNPNKFKESVYKWRKSNPEKAKAINKRYKEQNKEKIKYRRSKKRLKKQKYNEPLIKQETKICTKCGIEKPATSEFFHINRYEKSWLMARCRKCRNLEQKEKYKLNPRIKEYSAMYREKYPEKAKEYGIDYRSKNKEKAKEYNKIYRKENKEKINLRRRLYYKENKSYFIDKCSMWRRNNPEKDTFQRTKYKLKKTIGAPPPPELVEIKVLINKTKKLCKTLKN